MTTQNGFGSGTPANLTWQNDGGAYTFGQRFRVTASGLSCTKIRFYLPAGSPDGAGGGYAVALYAVGNTTPLASASGATFAVGWNEVTITTTALTSGADYLAAVLAPRGRYGADTVLFGSGDYNPVNDLYFMSAGSFNVGSTLTYPSDTFGTPWYGVDVVVDDGAGSNTADFTGTAPSATGVNVFTVTTAAFAGSAPSATGANSFNHADATFAGSAPSATGVNVFARPISVAADGTAPSATGANTFRLQGEAEETPGSWYALLDISREYRERLAEERTAEPVACPNDGEPLRTGPRGELYCPYDGWRPSR